MKVIITGSTGMVGNTLLKLCLQSNEVTQIINIVRKNNQSNKDEKMTTVVISDFLTYDNQKELFEDVDVAHFCIGAYTGSVSDDLFKQITVDYAVNFAKKLKDNSPNAKLCLLSGAGADRSEKSRTSFARYKGMAENQISKLGLEFYTFRPGYIYPVEPRKEPNLMYKITRLLYPLIRLMGSNASIKSTELAEAMYEVGLNGSGSEILENKDILNQLKK